MQPFVCIGLNHHTAPLALREKFAWEGEVLRAYMHEHLASGKADEVVVLSTCNRVEAYFGNPHAEPEELLHSLANGAGVALSELDDKAYHLEDGQVVQHLFRVAAGLDSMAIGEHQILGQVARAYDFARECGAAGKQLSKLFQGALACGKRVQTETRINQLGASVPSLAVKLAAQQIPDLAKAAVLIVGAGDMAGLAVQAFRKRGVMQFTVANRTWEGAQKLAASWGAKVDVLENIPDLIGKADIILASSSAPHHLITAEMLRRAAKARASVPLVILDIAVPRDVDPAARRLDNIHLYDIDDLEDQAASLRVQHQAELSKAVTIVEVQLADFTTYLQEQQVVPLIKRVRGQAEAIRKAELERALRNLPELGGQDLEQIDRLTRSIVKKLLHHPTLHLRQQAAQANGDTDQYAKWVEELFGLDDE